MDHAALRLSLELATLTTLALLVIGLPIAGWLARSRWRFKFVIEALVALPLVLPPTVLGFYLLFGLGPQTWAGRLFERLAGHPFPFSFAGLLVASILYSLPFAVQPFAAALGGVDARLVEASYTLGASRVATFFRVTLPLAWNGVLAGAVLAFAHTLGEFGVVLMVGGNIAGETRTLSIAIFDHVEALEYDAANRTAALLLAISFSVLVVVYALQRRPPSR
ncbi:MAG TPA: molybdate ABC transporter permease subunit [Anaeromyxobacteraceae bacterium]|nr:molybdate ABC transporter permease subunit [Anaeromyxobacteraceae bacterium]